MPSLTYTIAESDRDLNGIIELQRNNLSLNLSVEEIAEQGFVTVVHSFKDLKKLNDIEPHIICKDDEKVVAYILAMTAKSQKDIPVLIPMFELFTKIFYKEKPVSTYNYMVIGQVCVDKNFRGQGVLDQCYESYRKHFKDRYDFAITEIADRNTRSIKAHQQIGFSVLQNYTSPDLENWSIVIWNW